MKKNDELKINVITKLNLMFLEVIFKFFKALYKLKLNEKNL